MLHIGIIIVNWNGKKNTLACLASLQRLQVSSEHVGVIVVDNGSSDGSVDTIRKRFFRVQILEAGKNLGFTGGNNIGISHALKEGAEYIWLLNNDTTVEQSTLTELVNACADKQIGIAGSKIYFAPGHEFHKDKYRPNERGKVLWYAGGIIDWNNMYASHRGVDEVDTGTYDQLEETAFITGCSMMIKRDVIEAIGLFDNQYYLYLEDVDFCLRAKRAGFKMVYVPSSKVWHVNAGSSGGPGNALHEYYLTRNRLLLGLRFAPFRTKIALLRESIRILQQGSPIKKQAIKDFFLRRLGDRPYETNYH